MLEVQLPPIDLGHIGQHGRGIAPVSVDQRGEVLQQLILFEVMKRRCVNHEAHATTRVLGRNSQRTTDATTRPIHRRAKSGPRTKSKRPLDLSREIGTKKAYRSGNNVSTDA